MERPNSNEKEASVDAVSGPVFVDRRELLIWRLFHGTFFMLGGLCFIAGCAYILQLSINRIQKPIYYSKNPNPFCFP